MKNKLQKGQATQQLVTNFFDGYVDDFYSIYESQSLSSRIINNIFRRSMYKRFSVAREIFLNNDTHSLLDVGCGTGVHDVELCVNDKISVLGVDIAENMISKARQLYENQGDKSCSCDFVVSDFATMNFDQKYDAILSLGVLEYIEDIAPFLKKMIQVTNKVIVVSLPVKWNILTPQRKFRYWLRNCPLYFYSESRIKKIIHEVGINDYSILNLGRDYLLVIKV
jgi:ubiquinone/menaquinone biosynthesis C-methylase UbiE